MTVSYRLSEIAERLGGRVLGRADTCVSQVATLEAAQPAHISFLTNSRYRAQLGSTKAGAVILGEADADATSLPRIISANPYAYFARVSALLNPLPQVEPGIQSAGSHRCRRHDRPYGQHRGDCGDRRGGKDRRTQRGR